MIVRQTGPCRIGVAALLAVAALAGFSTPSAAGGPDPAERISLDAVPIPQQVYSRSGPLTREKSALVAMDTAPFPYSGTLPKSGKPFFDVTAGGRRGHRTSRGVLWEDETFADNRVLMHLPKGFDVRRPSLMVVFFHGHGATVSDDVFKRQQVPAQIAGANVVLVAPQLAVNAADSSIGKLWQPGAFARFLGDAARELAKLHGDQRSVRTFATMPVVIVAYSGGYVAAAWSVHHGGVKRRLRGVLLLDALYGEVDKFADWIIKDRTRVFISAFTSSTRARNDELQRILAEHAIPVSAGFEPGMGPGSIAFLDAGSGSGHRDFVTNAWTQKPVSDLLHRLSGYAAQ